MALERGFPRSSGATVIKGRDPTFWTIFHLPLVSKTLKPFSLSPYTLSLLGLIYLGCVSTLDPLLKVRVGRELQFNLNKFGFGAL